MVLQTIRYNTVNICCSCILASTAAFAKHKPRNDAWAINKKCKACKNRKWLLADSHQGRNVLWVLNAFLRSVTQDGNVHRISTCIFIKDDFLWTLYIVVLWHHDHCPFLNLYLATICHIAQSKITHIFKVYAQQLDCISAVIKWSYVEVWSNIKLQFLLEILLRTQVSWSH